MKRLIKKQYYKKRKVEWTKEEDEQLLKCVRLYGQEWSRISKLLMKSMIKCHKRYLELKNPGKADAPWSEEEDKTLKTAVKIFGESNWKKVAECLPNRIHKQCRERWVHKLNPNIVKKIWTLEEDQQILRLYHKIGSKWTEISKTLEGRTDNMVKNRFNSNLKKRIEAQDPTLKEYLDSAAKAQEKKSETENTDD